ncbi:cysteine-rich RLK (RECEPTOR-like protein kinase) 26 [Artemisia annua]|uniref:Cysteine-rich RLK (RECEPTOR-like protein kinase) 26 n=1 Tax=Artemisia annua TaxID=35608 RepID=A0A2U1LJ14_ARTAN|nr:cysteine-rich RLK (RECEPTOR-like protein kinase) 26 [Artemisia annua]
MLMPTGKFVLWFFLTFMYLTNFIILAQPDFRYHICGQNGNYTRNSTYQRNLNTTLSTLPNTSNGFGFFNFSADDSSRERVYSVALCQGDVEPDVCRGCINDSIIKLPQLCPNQKEAVGYYGQSNDPDQFNRALGLLMNQLRAAASGGDSLLKYASGNTPGPGLITIYGLVQCTPDLSETQCNDCVEYLSNIYAASYSGRIGGTAFLPMCRYSYDIQRFFNGSKKSNMTKSIIIVIVIVTLGAVIMIASTCIFLISRKKKKMNQQNLLPLDHAETESMDDIGNIESFQYNFSTMRAATNDFSEDNKLGHGGFGVVYKGTLADGREIAVKRLARDSSQGDIEFKNEVLLVAKLQHRNLVRMLGFSLEGSERVLIYEFLPNESLDKYIFDNVSNRPTMSSVVLMLSSLSLTLPVPSEPAFFMGSNIDCELPDIYEDSSATFSGHSEKSKLPKSRSRQFSVNDISLSDIVPRVLNSTQIMVSVTDWDVGSMRMLNSCGYASLSLGL